MRKILLAFLLLHIGSAYAQQYYFRQFTTRDGLPGTRAYHSTSGPDGRIWIATENGVAVYDGYEFTRFTQEQGFPDYGAYHTASTTDGKIWFVPFNGKLCYVQHQQFGRLPDSLTLSKEMVSWITPIKDSLYIGTRSGTAYVYHHTSGYCRPLFQTSEQLPINHLTMLGKRYLLFYGVKKILVYDKHQNVLINLPILNNPSKCAFVRFLPLRNGKVLITCSEGVYTIDSNLTLQQKCAYNKPFFDKEIIGMFEDNNGDVWLSNEHGLMIFKSGVLKPKPDRILISGKLITSIQRDFEGSYWATSASGIYYFRNPFNPILNAQSGLSTDVISGIGSDGDGDTWVLLENGDLGRLEGENFIHTQSFNTPNNFASPELKMSPNKHMVCVWPNNGYLIKKRKLYPFNMTKDWVMKDSRGNIWQMDQLNAIYYRNGKRVNPDYFHYSMFPRCFDQSGNLWFNSKLGAMYMDSTGKIYQPGAAIPEINNHIMSIYPFNEQSLVVFTKNDGIHFIQTGKTPKLIKSFPAPIINQVFQQNQNTYWLASPQGLFCMAFNKTYSLSKNLSHTTSTCLPTNDVQCVMVKDHKVYAGTRLGLTLFDVNYTTHIPPPKIIIETLKSDTLTYHNNDTIQLDHRFNKVNITYKGISFRSDKNIEYKYSLSPLNKTWTYTKSTSLDFYNLQPGKYVFEVYAKNSFGQWSKQPAIIRFEIIPAYWQTIWFKLMLGILVLLLLVSVILYRIKLIKRKAFMENRVLASDLQALQAQMNPHFIFNSLNSIQDFILDHKPEEANYYLTRFATLMRLIVDYSTKESISLQRELDFLHLYMELEKLRFPSGFQFTIINEVNEPEQPKISPMMIQPLLENAVKHGLNRMDVQAEINLKISRQHEILKFEITDNGKGMAVQNMIKPNSQHQSVGLQNIIERIELLGKKGKGGIQIENLFNENGQPSGTKVTLYLPILNYTYD